jgi:hypothetical protein
VARHKYGTTGALLLSVLIAGMTPGLARGDDGAEERARTIRLYATASTGPIGMTTALGGLTINGLDAYGEHCVWNGDLLQAPDNLNVRVSLDSVGEVTLLSGAAVRLATTLRISDDGSGDQRVLIASLLTGDLIVKLRQDASAYIEAGNYVLISSSGAMFRVTLRGDHALVDTAIGSVRTETQNTSPTIKPRAVQARSGRWVPIPNTQLAKKKGQSSHISVQWLKYYGRLTSGTPSLVAYRPATSGQVGQIEQPVVARLVHFRVEPSGLGTIDPQAATTDQNGVVSVIFTAGNRAATGQIVATIDLDPGDPPGTQTEEYRRDVIVSLLGFWRPRNEAIIGGIVGGAIIGGYFKFRNKGNPIMKSGPPIIIP